MTREKILIIAFFGILFGFFWVYTIHLLTLDRKKEAIDKTIEVCVPEIEKKIKNLPSENCRALNTEFKDNHLWFEVDFKKGPKIPLYLYVKRNN